MLFSTGLAATVEPELPEVEVCESQELINKDVPRIKKKDNLVIIKYLSNKFTFFWVIIVFIFRDFVLKNLFLQGAD